MKTKSRTTPDNEDLILRVVRLGQLIRGHRAEGRMQSVPPPTIFGYQAMVRMARKMPHLTPDQVALVTVLGNASPEDRKLIPGLLNQVFGLRQEETDNDPAQGGGMF